MMNESATVSSAEVKSESVANKKKSRKKLFIVLLVIAVVIILGIVNVVNRNKGKAKIVKTVLIKASDLSQEVSANGEIASRETAAVVAKISGSIKRLYVEVGSQVRAGDPIVLIDNEQILVQQKSAIATLESTRRNIKSELLSLRTGYSQAKSSYEKALRTYENIKQSWNLGSASEEQLNEALDALQLAENGFLSARERLNFREGRPLSDTRAKPFAADEVIIEQSVEVKQAVANLNAINSNLQACDIRARIDGIITDLIVDEGNIVSTGTMIARLHNPQFLEVAANIDEVDIGYIRLGQSVKIESDSFLDRILEGEVSFIAPVIQRIGDTRVCLVRITFIDPENEAKVGASCSIFITVKNLKGVPVIPIEAYIQEDGKKYAFKVSENESGQPILSRVEISTGLIGIDNVELTSGLSVDDEIVVEDMQSLSDGLRVKPQRTDDDPAE